MDSGLERECAKGETETMSNKRKIKVEVEETKKIKVEGYCYSCGKYYSEEDDIKYEVKSERCEIKSEVKSECSEIKNEYVEQEILKDEPNNDDESESEYIEKEDDGLKTVKVELYCIVCQSYGHAMSEACVRCLSCGAKGHVRRDCREENWDFKNVKLGGEKELLWRHSLLISEQSEIDLDAISIEGANKEELIECLKCEIQQKCRPKFYIDCRLCNVKFVSLDLSNAEAECKAHYAGKRHKSRLDGVSKCMFSNLIKKRCIQKWMEREQNPNKRINSMNVNLEFTKQLPHEAKFFCELCHQEKQSQDDFKRHLAGVGHKKKKRFIELYIKENSVIKDEEMDDCEVKDSMSTGSDT